MFNGFHGRNKLAVILKIHKTLCHWPLSRTSRTSRVTTPRSVLPGTKEQEHCNDQIRLYHQKLELEIWTARIQGGKRNWKGSTNGEIEKLGKHKAIFSAKLHQKNPPEREVLDIWRQSIWAFKESINHFGSQHEWAAACVGEKPFLYSTKFVEVGKDVWNTHVCSLWGPMSSWSLDCTCCFIGRCHKEASAPGLLGVTF